MKSKGNISSYLYKISEVLLLLALVIASAACASSASTSSSTASTGVISNGFVTRVGTQLMLNGHPFRFAGANMHWLALDDSTNYPSQFRVNDGLDAAKEMGANVIRSHDMGISTGCPNCIEPSLGVFNQIALAHDDYVMQAASERGLRFIIPLTDNWHYPAGGKHNFTDWRGISDENQFYYNPLVIHDFETYISTLLNHVNIYTGVAYKDDPTILAWETGNELVPPDSWTETIATYIKSIDKNHLVLDGRGGVDPNAASLTNVDMVSTHLYPKSIADLVKEADSAKRAGKVFYLGEYDWNDANGGDSLSSFLTVIESDPEIAGDTYWELWSHSDLHGYVSNDIQYTLHYPGDTPAMRKSVQLLRAHAYSMRKLPIPPVGVTGVPLINTVTKQGADNALVWRGTALAASYTIERSTSGSNGPWTVICNKCVTDTSPPWVDKMTPGRVAWYRMIAYNLSGVAGKPSDTYRVG